jgi:hypothetical protein
MSPGQHHINWVMTEIIDMIRNANDVLLDPFGMKTSGIPSTQEDLKHFIFYCCDYALVNLNFYKRKTRDLTPDEKSGMLKAYKQLIAIRAKKIEGTKFGTHTVTSTELNALSVYLTQRSKDDLTLTDSEVRRFNDVAGALNPCLLAGHAADSIAAGFRAKLEKVRKRFNSSSFIDIRGCRAGNEKDYLRAIQDFFGDPASKPSVTAPMWYQAFAPTNGYHHPANAAAIHTLLTSGSAAADIRKGFAAWASMSHVEPEHKQVWTDAVDDHAAKFVLLEWRKKLPQLPVTTPGLTTYLSMNLVDFINKTKDFFNIPAGSMPSASALTAINTYVSTKLTGYAPHLFATVDSATEKTRLKDILDALGPVNTELGKPVDPAPVDPVSYLDLKDYQDKLIKAINDKRVADIKPFLAAIKSRINDSDDPGLYYYMLFSGMPVFAFAGREAINNHVVTVNNNRLVVLDAYADQAYREWAKLSWAEPLPAGNKFSTMKAADIESRRLMMVVEQPTGGKTDAAACPHEDYFRHITSV